MRSRRPHEVSLQELRALMSASAPRGSSKADGCCCNERPPERTRPSNCGSKLPGRVDAVGAFAAEIGTTEFLACCTGSGSCTSGVGAWIHCSDLYTRSRCKLVDGDLICKPSP